MVRPSKAPTEVELKFLLLPRERLAVARNALLAGATTQTDLSSVYYDTPDWALRKQGITLGVRRVNGAFLQTIKREAGSNLFDRGEWENEIRGAEPDRSRIRRNAGRRYLVCERRRHIKTAFQHRGVKWTPDMGPAVKV
jgi:triphosphatase